jgi:ethanolamine utilization protein EutQ (cupin superfamily)
MLLNERQVVTIGDAEKVTNDSGAGEIMHIPGGNKLPLATKGE